MNDFELAVNTIREQKRRNKYYGSKIGIFKDVSILREGEFTYKINDIVLFRDELDTISIDRPWITFGKQSIVGLPKSYVEEYDINKVPKGLYELNNGIGRIVLKSIDPLINNNHEETAFLLLLNMISGLSRRRYPIPENTEGLQDRIEYSRQVNNGNIKTDKQAFVDFTNEELQKIQNEHPECGLNFNNVSSFTMRSDSDSVGEWLYDYFRCILVHNTKTSAIYKLDFEKHEYCVGSIEDDRAENKYTKCIGFAYIMLLQQIINNALENDESF